MGWFSEQDRADRAELREASDALDALTACETAAAKRRGLRWWDNLPESDEFLAANRRVTEVFERLPWWKRLDI